MIATDIDGTILDYDKDCTQAVKDCIKKLTAIGVKVVLVTGRMYCATTFVAEELGLDTPLICYQGALIRQGDNKIYEKYLPENTARKIINWAAQKNIHLNLYMDDVLHVEHDDEIVKRYAFSRYTKYVVKPFSELNLHHINKLLAIDFNDADKMTDCLNELKTMFPELYLVKSTPYFCEISNPEAKKSAAVEVLRKYWGFKKEEVLAIGDQNNDIELLKAGGVKVAMGNATDELKSVADWVTDTVQNDGFVKAVEKFVCVRKSCDKQ